MGNDIFNVNLEVSAILSRVAALTEARKRRCSHRMTHCPQRIALSPFHRYELPNAIRLSVFRGLRDAAAGNAILASFQADLTDEFLPGLVLLSACNIPFLEVSRFRTFLLDEYHRQGFFVPTE